MTYQPAAGEIPAEVIDADRQNSESILARAHTTAIGALLVQIIQLLLVGLIWHIDPMPVGAPWYLALIRTVAIGAVILALPLLLITASVALLPATHAVAAETEKQYQERLRQESVGPSIAEAREFRNRALLRARFAQAAMITAIFSVSAAGLYNFTT